MINESERDRFVRLLFYAVVLVVGYLAFRIVGPFLAPLAWAGVFAMVLEPLRRFLAERLARPSWAAAMTTVIALLLIVGPAVGVLSVLVVEVTALVQAIQSGAHALPASPDIQAWYEKLRQQTVLPLPEDLGSTVTDTVKFVATYVAGSAGAVLQNVAGLFFQLFVMLFALFYFLRDGGRVVETIRQILPFGAARRDHIISQTHDLVVATVGSTFAVALTQGALTGLTLGLLGFRAPVFWGVMTAFFSLLPAVGSGLVWGPAAVYLLVTGDIVRGVILIGVGVGVIGMADNILRPLLLSGRTTMHGLMVFVSLLGGMAAFGFIGLVIGPVIMATFATLMGVVTRTEPEEAVPSEPAAPAGPAAPADEAAPTDAV